MSDVDQELAERAKPRGGHTLCGQYRIERVLGVSRLAFVYVAAHRNGRGVAIKMPHPELSLRADLRKRVLQEGHAANAVNHPGAVVIIDDDAAEDGAAFLVMELLEAEGRDPVDAWRFGSRASAPASSAAPTRPSGVGERARRDADVRARHRGRTRAAGIGRGIRAS